MAKSKKAVKKAEGPKLPVQEAAIVQPRIRPSVEDKERERKWKAEDALRDIERAEGHKKDKELMRDVKTVAREKAKTMSKICGQ